jgi:hypothetical protein
MDVDGIRERMLHEVAEVFDGTVIFGRDGMTIDAKRKRRGGKPI